MDDPASTVAPTGVFMHTTDETSTIGTKRTIDDVPISSSPSATPDPAPDPAPADANANANADAALAPSASSSTAAKQLYIFKVVESKMNLRFWKTYKKEHKIRDKLPPNIEILGTKTVQDLFKAAFNTYIYPWRIDVGLPDETWSEHLFSIEFPRSRDLFRGNMPKRWQGPNYDDWGPEEMFDNIDGGNPARVKIDDMGLSVNSNRQLDVVYDFGTSTDVSIELVRIENAVV
jgi:hypothetical protein